MDPVIDQLYKIEQIAKNMENEVDDQKEKLRVTYREKQVAFDQKNDQQIQEELNAIREESEQQQQEMNKKVYDQHKSARDQLDYVYKQKQVEIVNHIFENIIKG